MTDVELLMWYKNSQNNLTGSKQMIKIKIMTDIW